MDRSEAAALILLLSFACLSSIGRAEPTFDIKFGYRRADGDSVTDQTLADAACHAKLIRVLVGVCGGCIEPRKIQSLQALTMLCCRSRCKYSQVKSYCCSADGIM